MTPVSIKAIQLTAPQITSALKALPSAGFSKAELGQTLVRQGLTAGKDGGFVRRVMLHLKQSGLIDFDQKLQVWQFTDLGRIKAGKTLRLPTVPPTKPSIFVLFLNGISWVLRVVACFGLIVALIALNASFAWELGREAAQFRIAFVVGLMSLDLMRPFLVATGIGLLMRRRITLGFSGIIVAFLLSPVSVLSSTAILSSSFLLGAKMNADAAVQIETLDSLRGEHTRQLAEAERLQDAWRAECDRGGCGPLAAEIEAEFLAAQSDAQIVLDRIVELTEASNGASDLLARLVVTFERFGIIGHGREILLPLFLALSLELGALLGPALLLSRQSLQTR